MSNHPSGQTSVSPPSFKEAFLFWLKLGFISFGGPAGQISIMHEYIVEKKKWISESRFLHALNYCMLLPGPEAQQLATYCGWLLHRKKGGLTAGILFILPSLLILWILSVLYVKWGQTDTLSSIFKGLQPAVIAIILLALYRIGKKTLRSGLSWITAFLSFTGLYFLKLPFPIIILAALAAGFVWEYMRRNRNNNQDSTAKDESGYYINIQSVLMHTTFSRSTLMKQTGIFILLWLAPILLFYSFSINSTFWIGLSVFFTKAAFVTFGGAYAVLPYVAEFSVQQAGWLSATQMLDGLALGETTPGPLIMVLVFVGYLAGYNSYGGSLAAGGLAMITTAWFSFLPSFFLIMAGAPLIEKTHQDEKIRNVLQLVSAAVAGVILHLAFFFIEHVLISERDTGIPVFQMAWIFLSLGVLFKSRISIPLWIMFSGCCGYLYYSLL